VLVWVGAYVQVRPVLLSAAAQGSALQCARYGHVAGTGSEGHKPATAVCPGAPLGGTTSGGATNPTTCTENSFFNSESPASGSIVSMG